MAAILSTWMIRTLAGNGEPGFTGDGGPSLYARLNEPKGVAVVIEAAHQCMTTRGVHKSDVTMVTSRMLGAFRDNGETRREFLTMIGRASA